MYKAGIIGCGRIAGGYDPHMPEMYSSTHAGAYHLCKKTRLVAAADPSETARALFGEKWGIDKLYPDFEEMLTANKLDILSICLPTHLHYKAACAADAHGIQTVFFEKPISENLDEAAHIIEMFSDGVVAVNYFRRWNPSLQKIQAALKGNDFGETVSAVIRYTKGLLVNGSHLVDMARWFWGEPEYVRYIRTTQPDSNDPGIDFIMGFKGGFPVYFLNVPDVDYVFIDMDMVFKNGRVTIGQRGQSLVRWQVKQDPHFKLFNILDDPVEEKTLWQNCTTRAVEELVACMEQGKTPSCSLQDGYRALEICHNILAQANHAS